MQQRCASRESATGAPLRGRGPSLSICILFTDLDDLAHVLRRHVLLLRLSVANLALVREALGIQLLPLARLRTGGGLSAYACWAGSTSHGASSHTPSKRWHKTLLGFKSGI